MDERPDNLAFEHARDASEAMFLGVDALGLELDAGDNDAAIEMTELIERSATELDQTLSAAMRLDA